MNEKIRILIVDDHDEARHALYKLLSTVDDIEITGEAANGKEALINAAIRRPDVIIMDEKMPVLNGLEASSILSEKNLPCKVIMLTMYEQFVDEAIENGVKGYLLKGISFNELIGSIRNVYQGKMVIDKKIQFKDKTYMSTI
ncbi:response regulator transcription factor [Chloroflexota bacterium]